MKCGVSRKKQTAVKGRFETLFASILVHVAVFPVVAISGVVIGAQCEGAKFEGRPIRCPKMKRQTPKSHLWVIVKPRMNNKCVDFKMPRFAGFGAGAVGVNLSGNDLGGEDLEFATAQSDVCCLKSSGEKTGVILDPTRNMLSDEIGEIPLQPSSRTVGRVVQEA